MKRYQLPWQELAAYHEAGHIVAAAELRIEIREVRLSSTFSRRHESKFDSLGKLHDLRSPNLPQIRHAVRRYIRFLMGGPAARLLRMEEHHEIHRNTVPQFRFRNNWLQSAVVSGNTDFDTAYSPIFGWLKPENQEKANQMF